MKNQIIEERELLQKQIAEMHKFIEGLDSKKEQAIANLNALTGAVQLCDRLLLKSESDNDEIQRSE